MAEGESLFGQRVDDLLALTAQRSPYAGAGAMVALGGASAASLVAMVGKYAGEAGAPHVTAAEAAVAELRELADADADAFEGLLAAWKLPRDDPERARRIAEGAREASVVPLRISELAAQTGQAAVELWRVVKADLRGDAVVAARLAVAAAYGGAALVEGNATVVDANAESADDAESLRRQAAESVAVADQVTAALASG